jgi:hypothetical protein
MKYIQGIPDPFWPMASSPNTCSKHFCQDELPTTSVQLASRESLDLHQCWVSHRFFHGFSWFPINGKYMKIPYKWRFYNRNIIKHMCFFPASHVLLPEGMLVFHRSIGYHVNPGLINSIDDIRWYKYKYMSGVAQNSETLLVTLRVKLIASCSSDAVFFRVFILFCSSNTRYFDE